MLQPFCTLSLPRFENVDTCGDPGYLSLLHNEVQYQADDAAVLDAIAEAFLGVGVVTVDGEDNATVARVSRGLDFAEFLATVRGGPDTAPPVWRYRIRRHVGHVASVPRTFRSAFARGALRSDFHADALPLASFAGYYRSTPVADWEPVPRRHRGSCDANTFCALGKDKCLARGRVGNG